MFGATTDAEAVSGHQGGGYSGGDEEWRGFEAEGGSRAV